MGMQRIKRKAGVVLVATALLTAGPGFAAVATAQAAAVQAPAAARCWPTAQPNISNLVMKLKGTYNMKDGVGSVCANVPGGPWKKDTIFYVWCMAENPDSGVVWYYGRIKGTETKGYMSSDNLTVVKGSTLDYCSVPQG
jgi:hypothetical protein